MRSESIPGKFSWSRRPDLPGVERFTVENSTSLVQLSFQSYFISVHAAAGLECRYRGKARQISQGMLGFAEPGDVYETTRVPRPASAHALMIQPWVIVDAAGELGIGIEGMRLAIDQAERSDWFGVFTRFIHSWEGCSTVLERQARFAKCIELYLRGTVRPPRIDPRKGAERPAVRRVREYLQDRYSESVSLRDLVLVTGLSRFHLLRVFHDAVGLPPHAYQIQVRIERARELLGAGVHPAQVAATVGFADQSHFGQHFKRICKVSPGVYVRQTMG